MRTSIVSKFSSTGLRVEDDRCANSKMCQSVVRYLFQSSSVVVPRKDYDSHVNTQNPYHEYKESKTRRLLKGAWLS